MITGKTRLFGIVAHPAGHVRTPQAMNERFARAGLDAVMTAYDVAPDGLGAFVAGLRRVENFGGLVVTVPHKTEIGAFCDRLEARAEAAGAVNAIRREADGSLTGDLLDGAGFVSGLAAAGHDLAGRRVYLVGAGGAASAIALAIAEKAPARLTLVNRTPERLAALVGRLRARFPDLDVAVGGEIDAQDVIVNATSLGLRPDDPLPVDVARIAPGALVAEVIMQPEITALLEAARARGCAIHPGRAMLEGQLSEMFAFLTRAETETDHVAG